MRRSSRVYLGDLNDGKSDTLRDFLYLCHDATQYFVDLFWQRQDFTPTLADISTTHRGNKRFSITSRLSQALAKQAKECLIASKERGVCKPCLRSKTVTLCQNFVSIESFNGSGFDYAVRLIGSGAPKLIIPVHSTKHLNGLIAAGYHFSKSVRIGMNAGRLFVDFILEKPRPPLKNIGRIVGMDSNYKAGVVLSDGQQVAENAYTVIQKFAKRQKHTHDEIKSLLGCELKKLNFSQVKMLCIEDLKRVRHGTRGTFSRLLNRRMSHWLYNFIASWLSSHCEEMGIRVERKNPWKTSQYCRQCGRWDRRNRRGDRFLCVNCGHCENSDFNASKNLELLGLVGVYGLHSLPNAGFQGST